jgi:hypothetical protein
MLPGVYLASKKNGEKYYRASITYKGKHISIGSYLSELAANQAYALAGEIFSFPSKWGIENYNEACVLSFHKWVVLINYRDNHIYFKNPIYLKKRYFLYYISRDYSLKFDAEDLFYYAHHKILKRGGHLFVSDYGMQLNILSRYGIKNYAVPGRDYQFTNGDHSDYRYQNIEIINRYHGVTKVYRKGLPYYVAKIHIIGDFIIGKYSSENEAAIAYNKAVLLLKNKGFNKNFPQNFIDNLDEITYASIYNKIRISRRLISYADQIQYSPRA